MSKKFSVLIKKKIKKFNKTIKVPADKSLSIRALILASQCIGISRINNLLLSEDVINCIAALRKLGVKIEKKNNTFLVYGNGLNSFKVRKKITKIYAGNSGTTARLLAGCLATQGGKFFLHGDSSVNKRDMQRIINPLEKIGALFYPKGKKNLPLIIEGTTMPLAQNHLENLGSAQVKSSILLAALNTPGTTSIFEKKISRDHTENFLKKISADIKVKKIKKGNLILLNGQKNIYAFKYKISSDPSSAAFLIALALLVPKSKLIIHNVLCNPTRIGFIKILKKKMLAKIKIKNLSKVSGEPVGSIVVESSKLKPINCPKEIIPSLIDELPILFIISALTQGVSKFTGINEATKKESNRIEEIKKVLVQAGIKCESTNDSMTIYGTNKIKKFNKLILVKTKGDHRICMASAIFALVTGIKTKINNFETVKTSFSNPNFLSLIKFLGGKAETQKK